MKRDHRTPCSPPASGSPCPPGGPAREQGSLKSRVRPGVRKGRLPAALQAFEAPLPPPPQPGRALLHRQAHRSRLPPRWKAGRAPSEKDSRSNERESPGHTGSRGRREWHRTEEDRHGDLEATRQDKTQRSRHPVPATPSPGRKAATKVMITAQIPEAQISLAAAPTIPVVKTSSRQARRAGHRPVLSGRGARGGG